MIEHYINGKTTGVITPDTIENRDMAEAFILKYNRHYETSKRLTFKQVH